jgi:hypothetical protein
LHGQQREHAHVTHAFRGQEPARDRGLVMAVVAIMVVLFFGTAPFVQAFAPKTSPSARTGQPRRAPGQWVSAGHGHAGRPQA